MSRSWATRPGTLFWCWWFSGARWIVLHLQESLVVTLSFCLLPFMEGFAGHLRAWESALACASVSGVTVDFCHRVAWSFFVTKGGMEPPWRATVTGETNGYWPVAGTASPVWLAQATAQTQGWSLAEMASEEHGLSPCSCSVWGCCWLMQLSVLSFD